MTPVVLVHGGGFDARCWDLLLPHLTGPALAVDLPGRGAHPADLRTVTLAGAAASVVTDVDAAGYDDLVLVGHSLAGCSLPATIGLLGDRVRHAVFVACTVPPHGQAAVDTLPSEIQDRVRRASPEEPAAMDAATAKVVFGNDLDDERMAWCAERLVPEAVALTTEPVDLTPLRRPFPRTWVRPLLDAIVDPAKQLAFAANARCDEVVDLDAAHMCMISRPRELAAVLNRVAATA